MTHMLVTHTLVIVIWLSGKHSREQACSEVGSTRVTAERALPRHANRARVIALTPFLILQVLAGHAAASDPGISFPAPIAQDVGLTGRSPELPKATANTTGSLETLSRRLAAQVEGHRLWQAGTVMKVTRGGFHIDLGTGDGVARGLRAEVVRVVDGEMIRVAEARVTDAGNDWSLLHRTDRTRVRRVKKGDVVRIFAVRTRLLVADIAGTAPRAISEALRNSILAILEDSERLEIVRGSAPGIKTRWPRGQATELCNVAKDARCAYAAAGWAELDGDSLRVVLGLVDVFSCETAKLFAVSVRADAALVALAEGGLPSDASPGLRRAGGATVSPYVTGLRPVLQLDLKSRALAVYILSDAKALCVVNDRDIEIYEIGSANRDLVHVGTHAIEPPPLPRQCRDRVARVHPADSDGDGTNELVVRSSVFTSPVAFSVVSLDPGHVPELQGAETFWLPWSEPLGDARYVPGKSCMSTSTDEGSVAFYDWRAIDLDGDGLREILMTDTNGALTVRDSTLSELSRLEDVGSPLEVHDMDLDKQPEIIVSSSRPLNELDAITFYNWSGTGFEKTWSVEDLPAGISSLAAGFLDGDNLPDLVALFSSGTRAEASGLLVMLSSDREPGSPGKEMRGREPPGDGTWVLESPGNGVRDREDKRP